MKSMRSMAMAGFSLWLALAGNITWSEQAKTWPPFEQIVELIEANLPEIDRAELNAAIVQALLDHYHPRVILVPDHAVEEEPPMPGTLTRTTVFDRSFGYLRVDTVGPGLDLELRQGLKDLEDSDRLLGLVLDLRFTGGQDYLAAARTADLFVGDGRQLLSWQDTVVHSTSEEDIIALPVVVLINGSSFGAAEALAGVLREAGSALLVGSRTAGHAYVFRDVELPGDRILRVASEPVLVAEGISVAGGLPPDIEVLVSPEDEKQYLDDPYAVIPGAIVGTALRAQRARINEAELMREHQMSIRPKPAPDTTAKPPARMGDAVVQDPALARALDLLKGIAIVGRRQ